MRQTLCFINRGGASEFEGPSNFELRLNLKVRATRDAKELFEFSSGLPTLSLSDIAWD